MTAGIAATGSRVAYFYCAEDASGAISSTVPAFKPIRMTQAGLTETANELKTAELRSDRHVATTRRGAVTVGGDIVGELSYGTYDDLLEAAFCGSWAPRSTTGSTSLSAASGSFARATGDFTADGFAVGDVIVSSGFTSAGNNGRFRVTAVVALTLSVTPLDGQTMATDPAATGRTIVSGEAVLVTGTTRRSFAILKRNLDIGVDTIYRGCEVNQLKLACPLQEKITATFSIVGKSEESYTVPVGATFASKTVTDYMTTFEGSLDIESVGFNAATQLDVTLDNAMAQKYSLFARAAYANKIGMIGVSGSLSAYIEDEALKTRYRNEVDTALDVTMVDGTVSPNSYVLGLPRSRFMSASDSYNGDDYGIQQINFTGLLDTTEATELKLTRNPA